jgi:hypothetical protein
MIRATIGMRGPRHVSAVVRVLLTLSVGTVAGCSVWPTSACSLVLSSAVMLSIRDAATNGGIASSATVSWSIDGTKVSPPIQVPDIPAADTALVPIPGNAGVYDITVVRPGYRTATQQVTVGSKGGSCPLPDGVQVTVSLVKLGAQ